MTGMFRLDSRREGELWLPIGDHLMAAKLRLAGGKVSGETLRAAFGHVRQWQRALDVGAHIGSITVQLAGRFEEVIAFEPDRKMFEYLGFNTGEIGNVRRFPLALADEIGPLRLSHQGVDHNSMAWIERGAKPGRHWVMAITFDSFGLDGIGLMKIDVEGAEVEVIKGARETIERCKPVVIIEENWCAIRQGHRKTEARELLLEMGMTVVDEIEDQPDTINVVLAWPEPS
jgi:FkbM family methyltransferase